MDKYKDFKHLFKDKTVISNLKAKNCLRKVEEIDKKNLNKVEKNAKNRIRKFTKKETKLYDIIDQKQDSLNTKHTFDNFVRTIISGVPVSRQEKLN